jgi:hypothetical protein
VATDTEQRLKELEAEVLAERARARPAAPLSTRPVAPAVEPPPEKRPGFFGRMFGRLSWKSKLLIIGGVVVAGVLTLWLVWKLVKIALYVGAAAAVVGAIWWLFFRKKK